MLSPTGTTGLCSGAPYAGVLADAQGKMDNVSLMNSLCEPMRWHAMFHCASLGFQVLQVLTSTCTSEATGDPDPVPVLTEAYRYDFIYVSEVSPGSLWGVGLWTRGDRALLPTGNWADEHMGP